MHKRGQSIIDGADIPSVPDVLQKILILADDPSSSSRDLEALILQEPGLVTHLLKTVNSAYYSLGREITSVNHAIVFLGFVAVKSIASGLALIDAFNNIPGLNKKYVLMIWRHSLTSAGLVKILSKRLSREKQDDLFLAAMVQNVGHLILAQHFQADYDDLINESPFPSIEEEQSRFQADHTEVGSLLLERWKFPSRIIALVKAHHQREAYQGEPTDIQFLETCDIISEKNDQLTEFLEQPKNEVDDDFLHNLHQLGWSWEALQEDQELLIDSVNLARQIIPA